MTDAAIPPGGTEVHRPPRDPWQPVDIARPPDSPAFRVMHQTWVRNQADFAAAGWLRWALQRPRPGHAWIGALDRARAGLPS